MNKIVASADEAIKDIRDNAVIMLGGFGLCGIPENLIKAVAKHDVTDLTLVSNECGTNDYGLSLLLKRH